MLMAESNECWSCWAHWQTDDSPGSHRCTLRVGHQEQCECCCGAQTQQRDAERAALIESIMDAELPRYAGALKKLGES